MRAFLVATLVLVASVITPALSAPLRYAVVPFKLKRKIIDWLFVLFAAPLTWDHVKTYRMLSTRVTARIFLSFAQQLIVSILLHKQWPFQYVYILWFLSVLCLNRTSFATTVWAEYDVYRCSWWFSCSTSAWDMPNLTGLFRSCRNLLDVGYVICDWWRGSNRSGSAPLKLAVNPWNGSSFHLRVSKRASLRFRLVECNK